MHQRIRPCLSVIPKKHVADAKPPESSLGARFRISELVRSFPPELLAEAEQALRAVLTSNTHAHQRWFDGEGSGATVNTTRSFYGGNISVTETLASSP